MEHLNEGEMRKFIKGTWMLATNCSSRPLLPVTEHAWSKGRNLVRVPTPTSTSGGRATMPPIRWPSRKSR